MPINFAATHVVLMFHGAAPVATAPDEDAECRQLQRAQLRYRANTS